MANLDQIDIKITLTNGTTANLNITTKLAYQAGEVYELLDKTINAIKEISELAQTSPPTAGTGRSTSATAPTPPPALTIPT